MSSIAPRPAPVCPICRQPLVFAVPYAWTGHGYRRTWHCPQDVAHTYPQTQRVAA